MNFVMIIGDSIGIKSFNEIYAILSVAIPNPFYNENLSQDMDAKLEILADKTIFRNELNYLKEKHNKIALKGRLQVLANNELKIFAERIVIF